MRSAWKCLNPSYISSENTTPASKSSHAKRMRRERFTGWNDSMSAASRSLARSWGCANARARSIPDQRTSCSTDHAPRSAARAWRTYMGATRMIISDMAHLRVCVERRPGQRVRPVPNEKSEQPPLESEGDARRRRRFAGNEADVESLAEEGVVQIERRRGCVSLWADRQEQLALELLQPLQDLLRARRRREEGIRRVGEGRVEVERVREVGNAIGAPIQKGTGVLGGAEADDLAHRESPRALERRATRAFVAPTLRLGGHQSR